MSLPQRIVVAVDGSDPSIKALGYALKLASMSKARVLLVHVMLLPSGTEPETMEAVRKELSAKGSDILNRAANMAKSNDVQVQTRMVETDCSVSMAIVDLSNKEKAELIVLGTKGISGYPRLMLGSTAAGAVSFASCPVLAVR